MGKSPSKPRKIQTKEDRKQVQKKKRESLTLGSIGTHVDDLADDPKPRWPGDYAPGSLGFRVVYALVSGWDADDEAGKTALAERLGTTRKFVASVEKRLRREGWTRETVVRYAPPAEWLDRFRYQRLEANAPPPDDVPF